MTVECPASPSGSVSCHTLSVKVLFITVLTFTRTPPPPVTGRRDVLPTRRPIFSTPVPSFRCPRSPVCSTYPPTFTPFFRSRALCVVRRTSGGVETVSVPEDRSPVYLVPGRDTGPEYGPVVVDILTRDGSLCGRRKEGRAVQVCLWGPVSPSHKP